MIKVLYVEDEPFLGKIVFESLVADGFDVRWETDGSAVIPRMQEYKPDICVIDVMLPNIDGFTLCRKIRAFYPALPVIFLTAKTEIPDLAEGFGAGGSDYIRKPFSLEELVLRIHNQLHLCADPNNPSLPENKEIRIGIYTFSPDRYELAAPSGLIRLSQRENQVLGMLVKHLGQVADRKELLLSVWGDDSFFNSRNLDVYIRKIREYFKEDPTIRIQTLKGKGYLLTC